MKKYKKSEIIVDGIFTTRISNVYLTKNERYCKQTAELFLTETGEKVKNIPTEVNSREKLAEQMRIKIERAKIEAYPKILARIQNGELTKISLGEYYKIRQIEIVDMGNWAGKRETRQQQWEKELRDTVGMLNLLSATADQLVDALEPIYHHHSSKAGYSDEEREAWIILDDIFTAAMREGISKKNPAKKTAAKCRKRHSTVASKNLSARGMDKQNTYRCLTYCMAHTAENDAYTVMLLGILVPVDYDELLGLNIGDWKKLESGDVSWLAVSKAYTQVRGNEAVLKELLPSKNAYRRVVCTQHMEYILTRHVWQRKLAGAKGDDPMFTGRDGQRLTPMEYKSMVNAMLEECLDQTYELDVGQRPNSRGTHSAYYKGDLLRGTAIENLKEAGLDVAQLAVLRGVDRAYTYAQYYTDFNNLDVMFSVRRRMEQAHNKILRLGRDGIMVLSPGPSSVEGVLLRVRCEAGGRIRVHCHGGITGNLEKTM